MKKIILSAVLILIFQGFVAAAGATPLVINLGGNDINSSGAGTLPDNALVMTFSQDTPDSVVLTIDATNIPTNLGKITDVWFNVDSSLTFTDLTFTYFSGVETKKIQAAGNVSGAGTFDIDFSYDPSGSLGDFYYGEKSVYKISLNHAGSLPYTAFADTSTEGYSALFKMNVTGTSQSGHYGPTDPVPEPATMLLFGTGIVGLAGALKRKRK